LWAEIARVVSVIVRSGRRTRPATSQPNAIEMVVMIASAIPDWTSSWCSSLACWRALAASSWWICAWS